MQTNRTLSPSVRVMLSAGLALALCAPAALAQLDKNKREKKPANPSNRPNQPTPANTPSPKSKQPVPPPPDPEFASKVLSRVNGKDWTIKPELHVEAGSVRKMVDKTIIVETRSFSFSSVAVVFPMLERSSSHMVMIGNDGGPRAKGELFWNEKLVDNTPTYAEGYQSGTRLGRWELRNVEGKELDLKLEMNVMCFETVFDENLAATIPWPKQFGGVAASALKPQQFVEYAWEPVSGKDTTIADFVKEALGGSDPKSMPPLRVAKVLAGAVQERVQTSGDGLEFNRNGTFKGFVLRGAAETLRDRRGSSHEVACVVAAVFKAAGLPARTVIGWDLNDTEGGGRGLGGRGRGNDFCSYVEFCLIDPGTFMEIWVPVDVTRMRKVSSRAKPIDQPWKYFGSSDELAYVIPLAFQYHPPTTVYAASPCLWGWLTTPETAPHVASLRFTAFRAARRGDDSKPGDGSNER